MLNYLKSMLKSKSIRKPIFTKDINESPDYLVNLLELKDRVKSNKVNEIERDIKIIREGIEGEKRVALEIENSNIPMIVLHDIRIPLNDTVLEFDYILITHKCIYILDTKTLAGNVTVDSKCNFLREFNGKKFFMYNVDDMNSIIKENEEIKQKLIKLLKGIKIVDEYPVKNYIILTNRNSVVEGNGLFLDDASKIVKLDSLISKIQRIESVHKKEKSEEMMNNISDFLITNSEKKKWDFIKYYDINESDFKDKIIEDDTIGREMVESKENDESTNTIL